MRTTYTAHSGRISPRLRVELEPRQAAALANLYFALFVGKEGPDDPLAEGLCLIAKAWRIEQSGELPFGSGSIPVGPTPIPRNEGSPE